MHCTFVSCRSSGKTSIFYTCSPVTGNSALSIAAREGHWVLLPSLVLAKASITTRDVDGWGPLHMCAAEGESAGAPDFEGGDDSITATLSKVESGPDRFLDAFGKS